MSMDPHQVADALRSIASKLERSKSPNRALVAADLRQLHKLIVAEETVTQQEQQALPKSGPGQSMVMDAIDALRGAAEKGDHDGFKKAYHELGKAGKI